MGKIVVENWYTPNWDELSLGIFQSACAKELMDFSCYLYRIENGHQVRPHIHDTEQAVFMLSGECDYYIDNKPYRLSTGSWVAVPSGVERYPHVYDSEVPCLQLIVLGSGSFKKLGLLTAPTGNEHRITRGKKRTGRHSNNESK